jgi:two-component system OmpR family response regulator/two-component system copper resistance phosphate regulon response regulator CusR
VSFLAGETSVQVLVVEDDAGIGKALQKGFAEAGMECVWVQTGQDGMERAAGQAFDAIILDLLLPGHNGLEIVRSLRRQGVQTPVIILTALGTVEERVAGLSAGADDYLVKPFAFPELMARIEAVYRRSTARPSPVLRVGELALDLATRRITRAGAEISLTPTEFSLLELLMRHAGQVVTRRMLCEHLWEADWEGATNVIEVHINRLRGKLDRGFSQSAIQTIRGRGYAIRLAE